MILNISADARVHDVQQQFHKLYPFLKIEFFNRTHAVEKLSSESDKISGDAYLKYYTRALPLTVDASEAMTVADFESTFLQLTDLSIQVYRRSGKLWIQTSMTDEWTLQEQNMHGQMMSAPAPKSFDEQVEEQNFDID